MGTTQDGLGYHLGDCVFFLRAKAESLWIVDEQVEQMVPGDGVGPELRSLFKRVEVGGLFPVAECLDRFLAGLDSPSCPPPLCPGLGFAGSGGGLPSVAGGAGCVFRRFHDSSF